MTFRSEIHDWIQATCPQSIRGKEPAGGGTKQAMTDDQRAWLDACAERGLTVPNWPKEYGGAELSQADYIAFLQELRAVGAPLPVMGMGTTMIGPTLLEYGTPEQKAEHLPKIARGEVWWCQGYSEPGAGSDLASLRTRAVDEGDHFVINGQKIWTTGAQFADWIFCLVRTDPDVPKHDGISFVLFSMDQPGVTVKPIRLISGASPFCETFFDNATARKDNLVFKLNKGWTVAKRLLQHERSGVVALSGGAPRNAGIELDELARSYIGETADGHIADPDVRAKIAAHSANQRAFALTQQRTVEESEGSTPGPATSIFKFCGANLRQARSELQVAIMGSQGIGWEGEQFGDDALNMTRTWLSGKAGSIAGGSNEVQLNIIAKRVLGLPD